MPHVLKSVASTAGKVINAIPGGQYIADAAALATGNPELIPAISGVSNVAKTGSLTSGLLSAGGSYLGSQIGGNILGNLGSIGGAFGDSASNAVGDNIGSFLGSGAGNAAGTTAGNAVGDFLSNNLGSDIGGFAGNAISKISSAPLSSALGGYLGGSAASSLAGNTAGTGSDTNTIGTSSFTPTQQTQDPLPSSLQGFGGLDQNQQASNLATQGVYGGGLGPDEQSYFTNLVNRQLVDNTGKTSDISNLSPIENSYLQNLGLGGYGNSNDLLQAISKWKTQ